MLEKLLKAQILMFNSSEFRIFQSKIRKWEFGLKNFSPKTENGNLDLKNSVQNPKTGIWTQKFQSKNRKPQFGLKNFSPKTENCNLGLTKFLKQ